MSEQVDTYAPNELDILINGVEATGLGDNPIEITRNEDTFTPHIGAKGEVSRTKNANKTGNLKLEVKQTAPFNAYLTALAQADEVGGKGAFPVLVRDGSGKSLYVCDISWITKPSDAGYAKTEGMRVWNIFLSDVTMGTLGN